MHGFREASGRLHARAAGRRASTASTISPTCAFEQSRARPEPSSPVSHATMPPPRPVVATVVTSPTSGCGSKRHLPSATRCGFRLYPLEPTVALIDHRRIPEAHGLRYRNHRPPVLDGLTVINLETRASPNGMSHFKMWRDNVRISWMHPPLHRHAAALASAAAAGFSRDTSTRSTGRATPGCGGALGLRRPASQLPSVR